MLEVSEEFTVEIDGELEDFIAVGEIEDQGENYIVAEDEYGELYVFTEDEEGELNMIDDDEIFETVISLYESEDKMEIDTTNLWDEEEFVDEEEEEEDEEVIAEDEFIEEDEE